MTFRARVYWIQAMWMQCFAYLEVWGPDSGRVLVRPVLGDCPGFACLKCPPANRR